MSPPPPPRYFSTFAWIGGGLLALVVAACGIDQVGMPDRSDLSVGGSQSRTRQAVRTIDDEFAALVDDIPGFGGFYYDSTQVLTIRLKNPTTLAASRQRAEEFLSAKVMRGESRRGRIAADVAQMRAVSADFDFKELLSWYRRLVLPASGRAHGVTMTDIDEVRNRIVVGVADFADIEPMRTLLSALELPEGAWEVVQFGRVNSDVRRRRANSVSSMLVTRKITDTLRPVPGGSKITNIDGNFDTYPCTLGFNLVALLDDTVRTDRYFVTNSHCTLARNSVNSSNFSHQPVISNKIGTELIDPSGYTHAVDTTCPSPKTCRLSDAALFVYESPSQPLHGYVARPANTSVFYDDVFRITEVSSPIVNYPVEMVGATSGRRNGTTSNVCADVTAYDDEVETEFRYMCQGLANYVADDGDSGAPVIETFSGDVAYAIGIHWGHSGTSSAFSYVSAALQEFYYDGASVGVLDPTTPPPPPPPFQVTIQPPFNPVRPNATCQFTAITSNGTGYADTWEWSVNSSPVGTNSPYLNHTSGTTGFTVSVIVTSSDLEEAQNSLVMSVNSEAEECFEMLTQRTDSSRDLTNPLVKGINSVYQGQGAIRRRQTLGVEASLIDVRSGPSSR